jgi:hypothetical protein
LFAAAEFGRQGIQETLFLRISVVVLLALAVDQILARPRRAAPKPPTIPAQREVRRDVRAESDTAGEPTAV